MNQATRRRSMLELPSQPLTSERFAPYGQVIWPQSDEADWQPGDAELELNQGKPRLYLMRLQAPGLRFRVLAAHRRVSQCLGVVDGHLWHIAVAAAQHPSDQPLDARTQLQVFTVPPGCIVKLHRCTWRRAPV
ncbi:MAG: ureidoglycolate lyase [Cyanobacteriota bacterium]|nr:ureidoglycolate lyase [Cyanobacteriota bacterium]